MNMHKFRRRSSTERRPQPNYSVLKMNKVGLKSPEKTTSSEPCRKILRAAGTDKMAGHVCGLRYRSRLAVGKHHFRGYSLRVNVVRNALADSERAATGR